MTMSILEFTDVDEYSGAPLYPAIRRTAGAALANTYIQLGETARICAVQVSNDDALVGIRVRFHTASSGADATQADEFIGANTAKVFYVARRDRSVSGNTLYINAVADV